ncbi:MAG: (4Fe-4S)-binding protein [Acidimicrobiia bacterium]|nr:(4Fe-4S)-binding protein [Acidimicrobiia bacterium]
MAKREYSTSEITVYWDSELCIHSGICLSYLPEVFDLDQRPWVAVTAATADAVAETIARCPSGALRYERLDGSPGEQPPERTTIIPWPNGPLTLRGNVRIMSADGDVIAEETRFALCRCGASQNQPFCDNSHRSVDFKDGERVIGQRRESAESPQDVHPGRGID